MLKRYWNGLMGFWPKCWVTEWTGVDTLFWLLQLTKKIIQLCRNIIQCTLQWRVFIQSHQKVPLIPKNWIPSTSLPRQVATPCIYLEMSGLPSSPSAHSATTWLLWGDGPSIHSYKNASRNIMFYNICKFVFDTPGISASPCVMFFNQQY